MLIIAKRIRTGCMTPRLITLAFFALSALSTLAQQPPQPQPPPQPPPQPRLESPPPAPAEEPVYDPLRAEKAIEVGRFYLKRGNLDAAIERFQDAARFKPGYAIPYRWMGLAYEKKGLKSEAVSAYKKYLELAIIIEDGVYLFDLFFFFFGEIELG